MEQQWIVLSGKEFKEMLKLNDNVIVINGLMYKFEENEQVYDDDEIYLFFTEDEKLIVGVLTVKVVLTKPKVVFEKP
jgi:hypothetical protein